MALSLRLLRVFVAVAHRQSFTRAAEQLGLTQPGVSKSVRELERQAGARLVERTPKGVKLTEAGTVLLGHARTMLAEVDVPNPDLTLSTGMTAETSIVLQAQKNVLTVPAGAVLRGERQASVLVVDGDNKVQKVPVTLGIQSPNRIEITQGISEHQSVIVSGQTNYQPGQVVHPQLSTISMPKQGDDQ